jgi:aldose 1-epimerase
MIHQEIWGLYPETGKEIHSFTLSNETGTQVKILTLGARVNEFWVTGEGEPLNIVLGSPTPEDCLSPKGLYLGSTVGRIAGRLQDGQYRDPKRGRIQLTLNEGNKTLHGAGALSRALWQLKRLEENTLVLSYLSPAREVGFPSTVEIEAHFTLEGYDFTVEYKATPQEDMPLSLSNHIYWNLNGQGSILHHTFQVQAERYLPIDPISSLPVGIEASVAGTPFDFKRPCTFAERLPETPQGLGYDHSFVLDQNPSPEPTAILTSPESGISLWVYTNQPTLHLYTGNFLKGTHLLSLENAHNWEGVALETQGFSNALNTPDFPSIWVKKGETYQNLTRFELKEKKF